MAARAAAGPAVLGSPALIPSTWPWVAQGGAAYGFDPLLKHVPAGGCLPVASNGTGQMTCAFWAKDPFHLKFCSETPWIPW